MQKQKFKLLFQWFAMFMGVIAVPTFVLLFMTGVWAANPLLFSFGTSGSGNGQFNFPIGVTTDSNNNIIVADQNNNRIQVFNSVGTFQQAISTASGPADVAVDASGNFYVAVNGSQRIEKYNSAGVFVGCIAGGVSGFQNPCTSSSSGTAEGQFTFPSGVAVDGSGNIYVVEQNNNRVQKFNSSGVFQGCLGGGVSGYQTPTCSSFTAGTADGQFQFPFGLRVVNGNLYVADRSNARVQIFDAATGNFIRKFGSSGSGDGQFSDGPMAVAVDTLGRIYTIDRSLNRVQVFSSLGVFYQTFTTGGTAPMGIAVDSIGRIIVSESTTHDVKVFTSFTHVLGATTGVNVSKSANISIVFDKAMDNGTLSNIRILSNTQGSKSFSSSLTTTNIADDTVVLNPTLDFIAGDTVSVTVPVTVLAADGSSLAVPYVFSFNVGVTSGGGAFSPNLYSAAASSVFSATGGNLNADDCPDIVLPYTGSASHAIGYRLNNCDGSGTFGTELYTNAGGSASGAIVVDINNDGLGDLVYGNSLTLQLNSGGAFAAPVSLGGNAIQLAAGDFNGDGYQDIVGGTNGSANITVYLNNQSGGFNAGVSYASGLVDTMNVATGDYDENGTIDIVVVSNESSGTSDYAFFSGNGTGTFQAATAPVSIGAGDSRDILAENITGELDIVRIGGPSNSLRLIPGNGDGTFDSVVPSSVTFSGGTPPALAAGDFDIDGDRDVFVVNQGDGNVFVVTNNGGSLNSVTGYSTGLSFGHGVFVTDFEGDGNLDALFTMGHGGSQIAIMLGNALCGNSVIEAPSETCDDGNSSNGDGCSSMCLSEFHVTAFSPDQNAVGVSRSTNIVVDFDEALNTSTVNSNTFHVYAPEKVAGTLSFSNGNTRVTFDPTSDFQYGIRPKVVLSTAIRSTLGKMIPGGYTTSFFVETAGGGPKMEFLESESVAATPEKVASADFDADGDIDIVVASSTVASVYLNDGSGNLSFDETILANEELTVADVDNDGDTDIVTSGSPLRVYKNNGSSNFTLFSSVTVPTFMKGIIAADFDNDGDLDLATGTTDSSDKSVRVYTNNGSGTFTISQTYVQADRTWGGVAGDFDNDSDMDFAYMIDTSSTAVIFLNSSTGTFTSSTVVTGLTSAQNLDAGDVDGDGDVDLIVEGQVGSPVLRVLMNNGSGVFTVGDSITATGGKRDVQFGDMDGDDRLDFTATTLSSPSNNAELFVNLGAGKFASVGITTGTVSEVSSPDGIVIPDLDGDGDLDLVLASRTNSKLVVFLNNALSLTSVIPANNSHDVSASANIVMVFDQAINASTVDATTIRVQGDKTGLIAGNFSVSPANTITFDPADDFKTDERIEVSITTGVESTSGESLAQGKVFDFTIEVSATASIFQASSAFSSNGDNPQGSALGDFDGDGDLDLLVTNEGPHASLETVAVYSNNGSGSFSFVNSYAYSNNTRPRVVRTGDLNTDGNLDFVINGLNIGNIDVFLGDGSLGFTRSTIASVSGPYSGPVKDFDGDGDLDVSLVPVFSTNYWVYLNNGNGTFASLNTYALNSGSGTSPYGGDFSNDYRWDLFAFSHDTTGGSLILGVGNGSFASVRGITATGAGTISFPVTADFNGDGFLDVAEPTFTGGSNVMIFLGDGEGRLTQSNTYDASSTSLSTMQGADFDADGDIDLVFSGSNIIKILENDGNADFSTSNTMSYSGNYSSISLGDLDSDGDLDVVGTLSSTDQAQVLLSVDVICGNTIIESGEQCDDGNTNSGDACSNICQLETPFVTNVSSTLANGSYPENQLVDIQVTFDQIVNVNTGGGTPTLALNSGGTATYASGTGTTTLTFNYTVAAGHNSSDLDYSATNSLALNGGTIRSILNTNANLALPTPGAAGSLGFNKNIVIDTTAPSAPSITASTPATPSSNANPSIDGTSEANASIDLFLNASCSGPADYSGSSNGSGNFSISVTVTTNAATTFYATATDAAGNVSACSSGFTYTHDSIAPTVNITTSALNPTNVAPVPMTATFSEAVTGFTLTDVQVTNGTAGSFNVVNAFTYTFSVAPASNPANISVEVFAAAATDLAGNNNSASNVLNITYDGVAPTVGISSVVADPTNVAPIPIDVLFSKPVTGFTSSDLILGNGTLSNFAGSGTSYSFDLTPSAQGTVTVDINAGVAQDNASNGNTAAPQFSRFYDSLAPNGTISINNGDNFTLTTSVTLNLTCDDGGGTGCDQMAFSDDDLTYTSYEAFATNKPYTLPSGDGLKTVYVKYQDELGNTSAAFSDAITVDTVAPTLQLTTAASMPVNALFTVDAIASESTVDFDAGDVIVTNGTLSNFAGSGTTYSFDITPTLTGDVFLQVNADSLHDAATNGNTAAALSVIVSVGRSHREEFFPSAPVISGGGGGNFSGPTLLPAADPQETSTETITSQDLSLIDSLSMMTSWVEPADYQLTVLSEKQAEVVESVFHNKVIVKILAILSDYSNGHFFNMPERGEVENVSELMKTIMISFSQCFSEAELERALQHDFPENGWWWAGYWYFLDPFMQRYFGSDYLLWDSVEDVNMLHLLQTFLEEECSEISHL